MFVGAIERADDQRLPQLRHSRLQPPVGRLVRPTGKCDQRRFYANTTRSNHDYHQIWSQIQPDQVTNTTRSGHKNISKSGHSALPQVPLFDPDTNMTFLCGKGDRNIQFVEISTDSPFIIEGLKYSGDQSKG